MAVKRKGAGRQEASETARQHNREEPLSLERIVSMAIDLLDADGVDGLSMRKLADRLGAGAMSLYWHVDSKDQVFDLALDAVLAYGGPATAPGVQAWRGEIVHMLEDWRAVMLRHPWSAALLPRRALGPNILARLELLGRSLSRAGVADTGLNVAIWSLWNYVIGATTTRASFDRSDDDQAAAQLLVSGLGERYPTIARTALLLDKDWEGTFKKGLDALLDGLVPRQ